MLLEDLRTEVKAKRPSIEAKHNHHIFQGDFKAGDKDAPTGYHSKNGKTASATHEAYGGTTDVPNDVGGVYQQSVRSTKAPFKKKDYRSTFFPDDATEDDILDAITSVYGLGSQSAAIVLASLAALSRTAAALPVSCTPRTDGHDAAQRRDGEARAGRGHPLDGPQRRRL